MLEWDNTARRGDQACLFEHFSYKEYKEWLYAAKRYTLRQNRPGEDLVFINAWNEWAEGHYICPHRSGGFKYVQAVRDVFTKCDNLPDYRLPETLGLGPYDRTIDWAAPEVKWNEK